MITTLTGDNIYELQQTLKTQISNFAAKHGNLATEKFDAQTTDYATIATALQSTGLFAANKLVIIYEPGANKQLADNIETILSYDSDDIEIIFVQKHFDKRTGLYKALKKQTNLREFLQPNEASLATWSQKYVKERGGKLDPVASRHLIGRLGNNQQAVAQALDVLLLYRPNISIQTIDLLVSPTPQSTVFNLIEALLAGNIKQAMALYGQQRQLKVEPQAILGMLAWQLHILALLKTANGLSLDDIARAAGCNPYVLKKSQSAAQNISVSALKDLLKSTLDLDIALKSRTIDADGAMQTFLLTCGQTLGRQSRYQQVRVSFF